MAPGRPAPREPPWAPDQKPKGQTHTRARAHQPAPARTSPHQPAPAAAPSEGGCPARLCENAGNLATLCQGRLASGRSRPAEAARGRPAPRSGSRDRRRASPARCHPSGSPGLQRGLLRGGAGLRLPLGERRGGHRKGEDRRAGQAGAVAPAGHTLAHLPLPDHLPPGGPEPRRGCRKEWPWLACTRPWLSRSRAHGRPSLQEPAGRPGKPLGV